MLGPGRSAYGPGKAGMEASTLIWAKELEGTGVTSNVLIPGGPTATPIHEKSRGIAPRPDVECIHHGATGTVACVKCLRRCYRPSFQCEVMGRNASAGSSCGKGGTARSVGCSFHAGRRRSAILHKLKSLLLRSVEYLTRTLSCFRRYAR